ncbi:CLUMA_CG019252, isoform A [Clunio marinus]|uniref:CLUMA_CG019252, isoform A n=1 Tax=Clunio marinus TaxID=568069 RepID=A0A1J1J0B9_9DIPT|nr:CLUMA_CG019252, isoform A [Clunio marinus]
MNESVMKHLSIYLKRQKSININVKLEEAGELIFEKLLRDLQFEKIFQTFDTHPGQLVKFLVKGYGLIFS